MKKYVFDKQLKIRVKPIFCKWLFPFANALIRILPKGLDKRKVTYQKGRAAGSRFHILTPKEATKKPLPCVFLYSRRRVCLLSKPAPVSVGASLLYGRKVYDFFRRLPFVAKSDLPQSG